jgi:hypothetical protein
MKNLYSFVAKCGSSSTSEFLPPLYYHTQANPVGLGKIQLAPVLDTGKSKICDTAAIRGKFALVVRYDVRGKPNAQLQLPCWAAGKRKLFIRLFCTKTLIM